MIPRARFTPPPTPAPLRMREVEIGVAGGLHAGVPAHRVPNGMSPALQNLVPDGAGSITPRSALSSYNSSNFSSGGPVLGAFEYIDTVGRFYGFAMSAGTVQWFNRGSIGTYEWDVLSYRTSSLTHHRAALSGASTDYFAATYVYAGSENYFVFSTSTAKSLKFFSGGTQYSDFTWAESISSTGGARALCSVNDRLVMFNTVNVDGGRTPTRVMWSARGNPLSFLIADGAGAEDLMDMRGQGQAAARFKEYVILFTEVEIWKAIPTEDDYAFRFIRTIDHVGTPWPRTVATTPDGVVFLGGDKEVYITDGNSVAPLGPIGGTGTSRIQDKLRDEMQNAERAWGVYNRTLNRYELYYAITGSNEGFPTRALYFYFDTQTWWPQTFPYGVTAGVELLNYATDVLTPIQIRSTQSFEMNLFESFGTLYLPNSSFTMDVTGGAVGGAALSGNVIDVRWRSPGLRTGTRKVHLKEIWTEYENASSSTASLWVGASRDASTFASAATLSLTSPSAPVFTPVWKTDTSPAFELRITDGGRPRIASFTATLQDASKF